MICKVHGKYPVRFTIEGDTLRADWLGDDPPPFRPGTEWTWEYAREFYTKLMKSFEDLEKTP